MRASWIIISALCAKAYSYEFEHGVASDQQAIGSFDDVRSTYQCNNGATPSLECVDSSTQPTCSCTCTNGITFNRNLTMDAPSTPSGPPIDNCDAIKADCDERNLQLQQEMADIEQKNVDAKKELLACGKDLAKALKPKSFKYDGCYTATSRSLTGLQIIDEWLAPWRCGIICSDFSYYGVKGGNICWCGNDVLNSPKKVADSQCNKACVGNKQSMCGGADKVSIYARED
ncbi:hypothetical protein GGP41_003548 [Bipolaris sorokiniana]|uniref:WSC domain-containing protein n=2 Tax=Cochliobolus sativus TaxID=45130 RepID=A0A8H5ZFQ5_COCSA|nr:uncharacterized protein COCSADRAFT_182966 [Bipolaris sorokiniana ND90Pr]EMD62739.1 hypothetical protein COCSADRAFT_182966 [Bipolaris sorokiniana ND90Pr]KAF5847220.1 hypothetical protein GGP41_003548 [Bipolaris sorokiniana]